MRLIGQIEDDILDVQLKIAAYTNRMNRLQKELTEAREAKRKSRISLPEMRARNKQRGRDFVAKLEVGDFIRLVGVRNTRFNWRKVVSFNESTVTGWTYSRQKDGQFVQGGAGVTTNGTDKIVEHVKAISD